MGRSQRHRLTAAAPWGRRAVVGLTAALVFVAGRAVSRAAVPEPPPASPEYAVKSAFLYNFARFVEWPAEAPGAVAPRVTICVLGTDPFGQTLDQTVAGKAIGMRPFAVARIRSVAEAAACAVVFVSTAEAPRLSSVLAAFRSLPVLTVGDVDGFAEAGGIIGMFVENERVRFEINVGAANEAHLKISSKLLSLARIVDPTPAGGR
jgi:hypothetical protein